MGMVNCGVMNSYMTSVILDESFLTICLKHICGSQTSVAHLLNLEKSGYMESPKRVTPVRLSPLLACCICVDLLQAL